MKDLQLSAESWHGDGEEYSVEALGQIVLECSGCGEYVILLGPEEDWPKEHRDTLDCSGCAKTLTLTHFLGAIAHTIRTLLRSSIRPLGPALSAKLASHQLTPPGDTRRSSRPLLPPGGLLGL